MNNKYIYILLIITIAFSCNSKSKRTAVLSNQFNISTNAAFKDSNALKITSWNIRDLGRSKSEKEILQIAQIIRDYDIVAIQEVVAKDPAGAQAVAKIVDELNRMGSKWDYRISDPTKSPSVYMSERYAFLWKTSKVNLKGRAYLDKELEDKCFREPFIAPFQLKSGGKPFYIINFHSRKFNDNPEEEIIHLKEYPKRLKTDRIFIVGDFNLSEKHKVWNDFYKIGFKSALKNTKTTLKRKCKNNQYLNYPIDNIYFLQKNIQILSYGHIDFVKNCSNLEEARRISDHLPLFLEVSFF